MGAAGPMPGSVKLPLLMMGRSVRLLSLERADDPPPGFLPVRVRSRPTSRFPQVGASCALSSHPLHFSTLRFSEKAGACA